LMERFLCRSLALAPLRSRLWGTILNRTITSWLLIFSLANLLSSPVRAEALNIGLLQISAASMAGAMVECDNDASGIKRVTDYILLHDLPEMSAMRMVQAMEHGREGTIFMNTGPTEVSCDLWKNKRSRDDVTELFENIMTTLEGQP